MPIRLVDKSGIAMERGCVEDQPQRLIPMLRLVFDTAALRKL